MKRRAFNLFCLVSMMIFAASVALWVRSYFAYSLIEWTRQTAPNECVTYDLLLTTGAVGLNRIHEQSDVAQRFKTGWRYSGSLPPMAVEQRGFSRQTFKLNGRAFFIKTVVLPLWLFLPFALPPLLWLRKRRKNRGRGFPVEAAS